MSTPAIRQYRPLTGSETIDYICAEIRKQLTLSNQFPLHRVFHELEFVGGVKVKGWGSRTAEVKFSGAVGQREEGDEEVDAAVKIEAVAEAPDLVRERLAEPEAADVKPHDDGDIANLPFQSMLTEDIASMAEKFVGEVKQTVTEQRKSPVSVIGSPILSGSQETDFTTRPTYPCTNEGCGIAMGTPIGLRSHKRVYCDHRTVEERVAATEKRNKEIAEGKAQ